MIVQRTKAKGDGCLVTSPLKVVIMEVGFVDDLTVSGRKQDDVGQFNGGASRNDLAGENSAATTEAWSNV